MLLRVDPQSAVPVFVQIAASIRVDAAMGRLVPGDRLSSAREVAASLGVNVHTVLHAYNTLRDEGLIDLRRGRGAVVTDAAVALAALHTEILLLARRARDLGLPADTLAALVKEAANAR
ncbi:GntR family transcriptional regulator [Microbacterium sp.]|uniref:GntR family transcriptional regulator n=1 Tax=Microbacterium sp. TaxID=51671 RepID=UPI003C747800